MIRSRRSLGLSVTAVAVPLLIALVFPHPAERLVLPVALMICVVIVLSFYGGLVYGLLASAASAISLWFFNIPPGESFQISDPDDVVIVVVVFAIIAALCLFLVRLRASDAEATNRRAHLELELAGERSRVMAMQQALLPTRLPDVDGVAIAWRYVTGAGDAPVGGDWCAFVPLSRGTVGIAIGDVVGHGLQAIAAMVDFRFSLRMVAIDGCEPAVAMDRLDTVMRLYHHEGIATGIYGVLDTEKATWSFANAGHVPPILVRGSGRVEVLREGRARLFSVDLPRVRYVDSTVSLDPGDLLVLYTDGLVERPGENIEAGISRLITQATVVGDLEPSVDAMIESLVGDAPRDDVAVVLVRYLGGREPTP